MRWAGSTTWSASKTKLNMPSRSQSSAAVRGLFWKKKECRFRKGWEACTQHLHQFATNFSIGSLQLKGRSRSDDLPARLPAARVMWKARPSGLRAPSLLPPPSGWGGRCAAPRRPRPSARWLCTHYGRALAADDEPRQTLLPAHEHNLGLFPPLEPGTLDTAGRLGKAVSAERTNRRPRRGPSTARGRWPYCRAWIGADRPAAGPPK